MKACTSAPWHVTHFTSASALESDSICVRCPAVSATRVHISSFWVLWHASQRSLGTGECFGISSGLLATQSINSRVLATIDC
jgi:hypothetical protein